MKFYTALSILVIGLQAGLAQDADAVKVSSAKMAIANIKTPQFQSDAPNKSWRPKDWLEVDLAFEVRLANELGGRSGSLASMTVNYYIGLNAQNKDNKYEVIKGSFNYSDIPSAEKSHALAYVAPATLRRLLMKDTFGTSDIRAWGFEILVGGNRVGGDSSTGAAWWEKTDNLSINDGVMLTKSESPFGMLWGDYDVGVKKP